eukprot:5532585-Amphidinium_carterae.1
MQDSLINSLSHLAESVKVDSQSYNCTVGKVTVFLMPQTACEGVTTRVKSHSKCKPNNGGIHATRGATSVEVIRLRESISKNFSACRRSAFQRMYE